MMDTLSMKRLLLIEFRWKPINRIKVINILNDGYLFIWPQQMHHLYNVAQSLLYCLVLVLQSFILWIWGSLYHSELCTIISREPNKQDTALTYFCWWILNVTIIIFHYIESRSIQSSLCNTAVIYYWMSVLWAMKGLI